MKKLTFLLLTFIIASFSALARNYERELIVYGQAANCQESTFILQQQIEWVQRKIAETGGHLVHMQMNECKDVDIASTSSATIIYYSFHAL